MVSFICESCGSRHKKWAGQCSDCNSWNCMAEDVAMRVSTFGSAKSFNSDRVSSSEKIEIGSLLSVAKDVKRLSSGIDELDNVLGGGFVTGSVLLIGGTPGIGKSTLLLQIANSVALCGSKVLYVSGEESVTQVSLRASRMSIKDDNAIKNISVASTGSVGGILDQITSKDISFLLIDSIQTMYSFAIESAPGSVAQIRSTTSELISFCKANNTVLILVGHVTKDGAIAGPKLLEHMVDVVVYFEGEDSSQFRILRSVKNRFGSSNEIGVFVMSGDGLAEVKNPSSLFLSHNFNKGEIVFVAIEGSRALLVSVEALVSRSYIPSPRRSVLGWDNNRLAMILAIMQTYCNFAFHDRDVYLNMAGGFKTVESANDLAVVCSLILAARQKKLKCPIVSLGEISLTGEIRRVAWLDQRVKESIKLGYKIFVVPKSHDINKIVSKYRDAVFYEVDNVSLVEGVLFKYVEASPE